VVEDCIKHDCVNVNGPCRSLVHLNVSIHGCVYTWLCVYMLQAHRDPTPKQGASLCACKELA